MDRRQFFLSGEVADLRRKRFKTSGACAMRPARDTKFKADPVQFGLVATINRPGSQISSAGRAQPTPPIAQCSWGGGLPPRLQMQAEVLELDV